MPMCARLLSKYDTFTADREDAAQNAAIRCMAVLHMYDATAGSAFNFFSTVIHNKKRDTDRVERRAQMRPLRACELLNRN